MPPAARMRLLGAAVLPLLALAVGCAPAQEASPAPATSGPASAADCAPGALPTLTEGTFTVATDDPAYDPWFSEGDPSNGEGYESAVAYAVAERLGYAQADVAWVTATFTNAIAPGAKTFDVDVNQVSITDERRRTVDFSSGYYDVAQAVVTLDSSPVAGVTSIAGLAEAKLGAQVGTTSYETITDVVKPTMQPSVFDSNDLAVQALENGQIDALVVDLPTGLYLAAAVLDGGKVLGQFPVTGTPEQFGFVLDKGSALTPCVTQAVDALRADGTLAALQQQWLTSSAGAPELT
ncbi:ABC transporter substrate-binding protein [Kineococcus rubinsiae]|uniref:ABC transporter substrate-binding protein n=1 Tax=Kineococcus rubinsiae TaxID=2609562 RepID=UPI0014301D30|nr:transporter substrate-binding domain-containing protein [Kineococcus rubinsiae]NIZ93449.1 amino acid ABC transporter substrate-binding protein [Kineococcus rubinsiae]